MLRSTAYLYSFISLFMCKEIFGSDGAEVLRSQDVVSIAL